MAISLDNYEPVEERISRFKSDFPDFRMVPELLDMSGEIGKTRWVVKVTIWKHKDDEHPASSGHAFEVDGTGMANKTSALENCETSAFGRALANLGYSGNRHVTREEMIKPRVAELLEAISEATDMDALKAIWESASSEGIGDRITVPMNKKKRELQR